MSDWKTRAGSPFAREKQPALASKGMVVTNHPVASAAGAEMLLAGGNAVDAAIAALFTLTVVEPMMVGPLGGGVAHLRLPDGRHVVLDGLSTAPAAARPDMYTPISDTLPDYQETAGRKNALGVLAMGVPGALAGWCRALAEHGSLPLEEVLRPAIRAAAEGFRATSYLVGAIADAAHELSLDPGLSATFLPGGALPAVGSLIRQPELAESLRLIAREGPAALYGGALGRALAAHMAASGGLITERDLAEYRVVERAPITGEYRGYQVMAPPPPSSAGVHVTQMLNLLEGYDLAALGSGSAATVHLLAEALKMAFADRGVATADPAFIRVPVERLTAKDYAAERRALLRQDRAQDWTPGIPPGEVLTESANTTHVTVADAAGTIVATTQTINSLFGARFTIPGTGLIANNYMFNFDPHPGKALSVAPGKRVFTSMAPTIVARDGKPCFALGLPGGLRIFGSAMQAVINLIDHGMALQDAVEAPRIWTNGHTLELEPTIAATLDPALTALGHKVQRVKHIGGGMGAVRFHADGMIEGAACWRADGTPVGISGGLARPGVRFDPEVRAAKA
ncbi:gamma-glutamyltransferase [Pseudoroseomonas cervicalis]|uniref:gamma-glutamyltransferase n=1 Tax=Teichococcus cervicalis TaxID=204525 RepID=UPI0022F14C20|nr:gamma-glutamyltransferase [Pseudoroseomonas cervicalis]WBV42218.1 gamma-glutamyltransferase [Pseudoroseomonas cervicalis]